MYTYTVVFIYLFHFFFNLWLVATNLNSTRVHIFEYSSVFKTKTIV